MIQRYFHLILLSMFLIGTAANSAFAQSDPVTIDVELSRKRVYVGDDLVMQVVVRGLENPAAPLIDFPESVRVVYNGRSSQSFTSLKVINGRRESVTDHLFRFQYTISVFEASQIEIPAPVIENLGQKYKGNATSFEAVFPTESTTDDIALEIMRSNIYLNESMEVECTWWISEETSELSFSSSLIPESFAIDPLEPPSGGQQRLRVMLNGEALIAVVMPGLYDGKEMTKLVFRFRLTPSQVGSFTLGPIRAVFTRRAGTGRNYRSYIETDPVSVAVEHVPAEGQPKGYEGAIGTYRVVTHASNTIVHVGDPITLTYQVFGDEPMFGIDRSPNLENQIAFQGQFKVASDGWRESKNRQSGMREFTTTIRPIHDRVTEIPPIGFSSFHPQSNSYEMSLSKSIPIDVQAVEVVTLSDAQVTGGLLNREDIANRDHVPLTKSHPGLWAHQTVDEILDEQAFSTLPSLMNPVSMSIAASGPTAFALSWIIVAFRRRGNQQSQVLCRAYRRCRKLKIAGKVEESFREYIAVVLSLNPDSVVAQDALMLPIHDVDARRVAEVLESQEYKKVGDMDYRTDKPDIQGLLKSVHSQVLRSFNAKQIDQAVQS